MAMNAEEGEAARKRRLKSPIRLGEAVALIGVMIAGLGLYVSHNDRQRDALEAAREAQQRAQAQSILVLRGEGGGGGGRIHLAPANSDQVVQSQVFYFPSVVRGDPVRITGEGRVDAGWFANGLKRALHGSADDGAERSLPVGVATTFVEDGDVKTDSSLYQIGFTIHPRFLQGAEVRIEGVALDRRAISGALQQSANASWARQTPEKP